jgi:hypothetical protein
VANDCYGSPVCCTVCRPTKRAQKDRQLAAKTQELSPWTGLKAGPVNDPSAIGTIGSGLMQGLAMQQGMNAQNDAKAYQNQQLDLQRKQLGLQEQALNQGQMSPWAYMNRPYGPSQY